MNCLSYSTLLFICYLSICTHHIFAQKIDFGKVSLEELNDAFYASDSTASAAILYDYAKTNYSYLDAYGFRVETERTVRIKIYNQSGSHWANISIPLYRDGFNKTEIINGIKGYSYNLSNGEIEREQLDKKDIYDEDVNDKWRKIKFALPKVKSGTVIEYTYTVISPFLFKLDDWKFQYDIPVKWSEYQLTVPAFYEYMILKQGYFALEIQEAKSLKDKQKLGSYTYDNVRYHWAMKNIPAFYEEEYMTTREDYVAKIMFQLAKVNYPGRHVKDYMNTWPQLVKDLMDLTDFGKNIQKNDTKNIVQALVDKDMSETEKAESIYNYVIQNFAWNNKLNYAPSLPINKLMKEKAGNCTDINLLLLNMLKKADIDANPVLLSTRSHGKISTSFPLIDQFNYTIVYANLDGQGILLDATDANLPFGMINEDCLNGYGLVANEDYEEEHWIDVSSLGIYFMDVFVHLTYDKEQQSLVAEVKEKYRNYASLKARKIYREDKDQLYRQSSVEELNIENEDDNTQPFIVHYKAPYSSENLGELVSLNAFDIIMDDNPFNAPKRYYPVDFSLRTGLKYQFNFMIPDGYTLEEWPQEILLRLEDGSVIYECKSQYAFNNLQIVSLFQINKSMIPTEKYTALRQLYIDMLSSQMVKIVLKKTSAH